MTRPDEAQEELKSQLNVTRQLVSLAKEFILARASEGPIHPPHLLNDFATSQGFVRVDEVDVDRSDEITQAAHYYSSAMAFIEAEAALTGQALLLQADNRSQRNVDLAQRWVWHRGTSSNRATWQLSGLPKTSDHGRSSGSPARLNRRTFARSPSPVTAHATQPLVWLVTNVGIC